MTDQPVGDLTSELTAGLENNAVLLGISRADYSYLILEKEVQTSTESVTEEHLVSLFVLLSDLSKEQITENVFQFPDR